MSNKRESVWRMDDIAAGCLLRHHMSPEYQLQQQSNKMLTEMLTAGISPDDLKDLLG